MKTLYLIRHAKSSWDNPALDDFDRPLNARGKRDAPKMGKRLRKMGVVPDHIISSPAKRAADTLTRFADAMKISNRNVEFHQELYHASAEQLLNQVRLTDDTVHTLFLFGHNPGLTDFANTICHTSIDNIVTAGVFAIQFDIDRWQDLQNNRQGVLLFYDFPKNKKKP